MDKILSYPSGLLEADVRAESHWAPCVHSPERPGELAPKRISWAHVTRPNCTLIGQAQYDRRHSLMWAGHVAQNCSLGTIPKTAPISELPRRFLKTKLRGFSNVR